MDSNKVIAATLKVDADQANTSVKSFKAQLKEANQELLQTAAKFGETSVEAAAAAKKVADLKDRIGDAKNLVDAFNPDRKFQAFQNSISGVAGGFSALQGVMALVGAESEDVQKSLLKVQAALAISQGVNNILDLKDTFKQLGTFIQSTTIYQKANTAATAAATVVQRLFGISVDETATSFKVLKGAIIATGLGVLLVVLGELVAHFDDISRAINGVSKQQQALNDINAKAIDGYVSEVTHVRQLQKEIQNENTTKERKKNIIAELNQISPTYFGNIKNETDLQQKLNEQVSKYVEAIQLKARVQAGEQLLQEGEKKKIEEQIQLQKDLAFAKSNSGNESAFQAQSKILTGLMQKRVKEIDEELKPINNIIDEANKKLNGLGGDPNGKDLKLAEERNKKLLDLEKIRLQNIIDANQSIIADTNRTEQQRFDAITMAENAQLELSKVNQKQQLDNATLTEEEIKVIEATGSAERIKIRKGFYDQRKNLADQYFQQQKTGEQELLKSSQDIQLLQIKNEREAAKQKVKDEADAEAKRIDDLNVSSDQRLELLIKLREKERLQLAQIDNDYNEKQKVKDQERLQAGLDSILAYAKINQDLVKSQNDLRKEIGDQSKNEFDKQIEELEKWYKDKQAIAGTNEELQNQLTESYEKQRSKIVQAENAVRLEMVGNFLKQGADLLGKQTVAGKALAVAAATIDTYQAANSALKANYGIFGPAAQIARFVAVAATIATGLKNVKEIVKTQVPGGGGSSSTASVPAVSTTAAAPITPEVSSTKIDQDSINSIGNVAAGGINSVRAYVVEQDSKEAAARAARLQGAAVLGG